MTLQQRDVLSLNGKDYALNLDILKVYFIQFPDQKPVQKARISSLHRGYFASFEIIEQNLQLVDLRIYIDFDQEEGELISKSVLENLSLSSRRCSWFSAKLILFSLFQPVEYLELEIEKGRLIASKTLSQEAYQNLGNHAYDYF